jgi:epoxyqueuosine reductase
MDTSKQFKANPSLFLKIAIKKYVATSSVNRLPDFSNEPIFGAPLVGFANGDDPIFLKYKEEKIIGAFHYTPREILEKHLAHNNGGSHRKPEHISVISFVMPFTYETRLSQRRETQVASVRWNHSRWLGQSLINELSLHLISLLEKLGYHAIAPELSTFYKVTELPDRPVSNWSQRHIAYAAGLGTFSLNDGFITPKGIAMRCGSVVCDAKIKASPRVYDSHLSNCLFYRGISCQRCIKRCPAGAISEKGHDKQKCRSFLMTEQKKRLIELGRDGEPYMGKYVGCGLCQTKVLCEAGIPLAASR